MEIASSVLYKLGFDWQVALANLINFLVVYFLLKKVVFNKLRDAIIERKAKAQEGVRLREEASLLHTEAENMKEVMQKEVAQERQELLEKLKKEQALKIEKANQEASDIKQQAKNDALKEKDRILNELESDVFSMTKNLTKKILSKYQEKPDADKIDTLMKEVSEAKA